MRVRQEYGDCPISFGVKIDDVLYHLIEESLMNSFRHGKATSITVHVQVVDDALEVDVQDDGVGASTFTEGLGLTGMRERVASLSGVLDARSNHRGFQVLARLPLR
jgi:signal transduction histidine kinase